MGRMIDGRYIGTENLGDLVRSGVQRIRLDPEWSDSTLTCCSPLIKDMDPPFQLPDGVDYVFVCHTTDDCRGGTYIRIRKGFVWDRFDCLERIRDGYFYSPHSGLKYKAAKAEEARRKREEEALKRSQDAENKRLQELGTARMNEIKSKLAMMSNEEYAQFLELNF